MTAKEAMEIRQDTLGLINFDYEELRECINNALEKQIPMKAVIHGEHNREINSISYTCPVCKSHIDRSNYCSSCGQVIIFEIENENDVI